MPGGFTSLGSNAEAIARDLYVTLSARLAERQATYQPMYPEIATVVPSKGKSQRFNFTKALVEVREFLGERVFNKLKSYSYELTNRDWDTGLEWSREELSDDQTGSLQIGIDEWLDAALQHPDSLLVSFLNDHIAGTLTEFPAGFDGVSTFSAAHNWGTGVPYASNQSNLLSGSNAGKLDLTYGYANIQTAYQRLSDGWFWPMSDGVTGRIKNKPTHILCSSSVYFDAQRLLDSQQVVSGSTATYGLPASNVLNKLGLTAVLVPGLNAGYWIMCDLSKPTRFALFQERLKLETEFMGPGSEAWFKYRMAQVGSFARYAVGAGLWFRGLAGDGT